jgi:glycosyltransferase involved in cell wall biosynthesis
LSSPLLTICIPTYNRCGHLANCLNSIKIATDKINADVEICISDNGSTDNTQDVVKKCNLTVPLKFHRNSSNIGIPRNFLNVINMASGEFTWLVGDDDLLLPDTISRLLQVISEQPNVDFFYVNAYHLTTEFVLDHPQPFNSRKLPAKMERFSAFDEDGARPFLSLIDPDVSFDFLGGMFLSVFRRQHWLDHQHVLSEQALKSDQTFSHFDNTFPHVKIFAHAFAGSRAYFNGEPMIVCLTGAREWAPLYAMIKSVRLVEATILFKKCGLSHWQYFKCRNFALKTYWPNVGWMLVNFRISGAKYLLQMPTMLTNLLYPNYYLSIPYYIVRKISALLDKL